MASKTVLEAQWISFHICCNVDFTVWPRETAQLQFTVLKQPLKTK